MKRFRGAMNRCITLLFAALVVFAPLQAAPRKDRGNADLKSQLLAHITELSSDVYEGREPGTEGEAKTLRYLVRQWFEIGLVSGTNSPASQWFAPVTLVAREPAGSAAQFSRKGRRLYLGPDAVLMLTSGKRALVENAPVLFVGKGEGELPGRAELAGRVTALRARGVVPGLATVLVGDDPGSHSYVAGKHRDCAEVGIESIRVDLPATPTQAVATSTPAAFSASRTEFSIS